MLGIGHQQITRTPHVEILQVMERPMRLLVPIGRVPTTRARLSEVIAAVGDDLGLGQVFGGCDPGAGVGSVLTWTAHRVALLAQRFGPELTINVFWRQPGALATVSICPTNFLKGLGSPQIGLTVKWSLCIECVESESSVTCSHPAG